MKTLKPPALKKGDTIGIVATSFPLPENQSPDYPEYIEEYKKGVLELEKMGFRTKEGKNLRKTKWWYAGTSEERANDINSMFADPEIKAIIVHEGGESAIAVLEKLDYELIKNNPKPFIGFSDITCIHLAQFAETGLVGFQGPLLTYSLGKIWEKYLPEKNEEGKKLFFEILTSTKPLGLIKPLTQWECWQKGKVQGQLIGGNLTTMTSLLGTNYFPTIEQGCILFWETDNTPIYRIEKALYQLKYSGVLDKISGMIIGKLPDIKTSLYKGHEEPTPKQVILEVLKDFSFPILGEVDFGHKTVAIPMPIGIQAKMDADNLELEFLESAVE